MTVSRSEQSGPGPGYLRWQQYGITSDSWRAPGDGRPVDLELVGRHLPVRQVLLPGSSRSEVADETPASRLWTDPGRKVGPKSQDVMTSGSRWSPGRGITHGMPSLPGVADRALSMVYVLVDKP